MYDVYLARLIDLFHQRTVVYYVQTGTMLKFVLLLSISSRMNNFVVFYSVLLCIILRSANIDIMLNILAYLAETEDDVIKGLMSVMRGRIMWRGMRVNMNKTNFMISGEL